MSQPTDSIPQNKFNKPCSASVHMKLATFTIYPPQFLMQKLRELAVTNLPSTTNFCTIK